MKISELMKTHVVRTTPDATLGEAVDLMDLYQTNGLPVIDAQNRLCGMLTENDVLRALLQPDTNTISFHPSISFRPSIASLSREEIDKVLAARTADKLYVCDYMTQPAISVSEHTDLQQAVHIMFYIILNVFP